MNETQVGRVIFDGDEVNPYILRDFNGVALFELVDGQYRIERLEDEKTTAAPA